MNNRNKLSRWVKKEPGDRMIARDLVIGCGGVSEMTLNLRRKSCLNQRSESRIVFAPKKEQEARDEITAMDVSRICFAARRRLCALPGRGRRSRRRQCRWNGHSDRLCGLPWFVWSQRSAIFRRYN